MKYSQHLGVMGVGVVGVVVSVGAFLFLASVASHLLGGFSSASSGASHLLDQSAAPVTEIDSVLDGQRWATELTFSPEVDFAAFG